MYIFKITVMWNVSHMNIFMIIYENFEHWIILISIFYQELVCVIYNWTPSNLRNLNLKFP